MAASLDSFTMSLTGNWSATDSDSFSSSYNSGSYSVTNAYGQTLSEPAKMSKMYRILDTAAGGATKDYDLHGTLLDFFKNTLSPSKVKSIVLIHSADSVASSIFLEESATNPLVVGLSLPNLGPGGFFALSTMLAAGIPVTGGTADKISVTNNDGTNTATFQLVVGMD